MKVLMYAKTLQNKRCIKRKHLSLHWRTVLKYNIKPDKVANFPHLEIAAIFLAHCTNYFLKENGKLAFVMPRSLFSADHHDNTRSGKAKGFKLTNIWDLKDVNPLFRIPSCVL